MGPAVTNSRQFQAKKSTMVFKLNCQKIKLILTQKVISLFDQVFIYPL